MVAAVAVLISQFSLGYGGSNSDEVNVKARQYNCPYYYRMNSGPQVTGLSTWLLLCMAMAALAVSTDVFSPGERISKSTKRYSQ